MTFGEIIYMCMDQFKLSSDDAYFTEEHFLFLLSKARNMLLKQRYGEEKKIVSESNFQTICLDLEQDNSDLCEAGSYLKSKEKLPNLMRIANPRVYGMDYFKGTITYVSRDRFRFIGYNKFMQNIIYVCIGPDHHLYFKSSNPQHKYLEKVKVTGVFEDIKEASELSCCNTDDKSCDIMDSTFPIEDALVPVLIELVLKEITSVYKPEDTENNANDDSFDEAKRMGVQQ